MKPYVVLKYCPLSGLPKTTLIHIADPKFKYTIRGDLVLIENLEKRVLK